MALVRPNRVIPVPLKRITLHIHPCHFLIRNLPSDGVFSMIQTTGYFQSFGRGRFGNQLYDRFVIS